MSKVVAVTELFNHCTKVHTEGLEVRYVQIFSNCISCILQYPHLLNRDSNSMLIKDYEILLATC